jgi:hypothetical protein
MLPELELGQKVLVCRNSGVQVDTIKAVLHRENDTTLYSTEDLSGDELDEWDTSVFNNWRYPVNELRSYILINQ